MSEIPDLLPESVRKRRSFAAGMRVWVIVWFVTALSTGYACAVRSQELQDLQASAEAMAIAASPLKDLQSETRKLARDVREIRERESWLVESDSQQALQLLGILSESTGGISGRVSVQSLDLSTIHVETPKPAEQSAASGKDESKSVSTRMQLDLQGVAVDDLAVASFIAGLRDSGVFESVELKSSAGHILDNHEIRQYDVRCIY